MYDFNLHSHISVDRYISIETKNSQISPSPFVLAANKVINAAAASVSSAKNNWPFLRRVIDDEHKIVCGHATFSDMRILLKRNKIWNPFCQKYLSDIVLNCHCKASSTPPPSRCVSLSSQNREFNEVDCLDHLLLDTVSILHCMDTATYFSASTVVQSTSMDEAIYAVELCRFSQFWPQSAFQVDTAFDNEKFNNFCQIHDIEISPVPPCQHPKNPSNPDVTRSDPSSYV